MSMELSFGQQVKARRRELGLTQDELARRVGCAPVTLRKIEYDDLRPSVQIAERLAMALNLPLEERAAFVRLAREERPQFVEPPATPAPALAEIGGEDLSGRAIRGYALGERIGAGGMGAVYRATQPVVEREVAVKIILPQYANQSDFIRRFEAEAQLVARLEHPHIVPLYDYWREPSVAYLVMRLLRGGSVQSLLQSGPVPLDMAVRLLEQIAAALGAAHRVGVVHRDLKPANVLLDEDQNAYLADFGIAKNWSNPAASVTRTDAIIGSPAYISPEQIRSEFVRPQTDIYCLGVMMYELFTGAVPFTGPTPIEVMHQHLNTPLPPLVARRAGLPRALDVVIERATAKDPTQRYENVEELLKDLHRAVPGGSAAEVKTEVLPAPARAFTAADNPYKGLRAFGEGDAPDFFGREALTQQLLVRLGEGGDLARFLAVVGPSGSGKSSVVKAGLIPALRRGALPGSEQWFIVEMLPGPRPLEELEAALLRVAVNPPASLLDQLKSDKRGLLRAVRRCLPDDPSVELVLVIDQFEEAFTLCEDEATRALFLDSLVTAALDERSRMRVILTLRADFTDRPLAYVDFGELMQHRMEIALPLTSEELEQAIVGPAHRIGLELEPGLVAAIIRDVGDQPGALPLLQYALTNLFEKCAGEETRHGAPLLTKQAYVEIGGVLGALGRRAEEVYAALKADEQHAARQLFLRLVTLGEGMEDTRRRVLRVELESLDAKSQTPNSKSQISNQQSAINNVIESFGRSRLLSFDRDLATRGPTVDVAHEALLREWPRLREWLSDSRADVRLQRQLMQAAQDWEQAQREESFLLRGTRLAQFEGWMTSTTLALTPNERAFYDMSIADRERREKEETERQQRELEIAQQLAATERARADEQTQARARERLRNRAIAVAGGVALVLAMVAGIFAFQSNLNAQMAQQNLGAAQIANTQSAANAATAEAASGLAEQQRNAALDSQATAQAEVVVRVTAQANAEQSALLAASRELAAGAIANLSNDPELSILLGLEAVAQTDTFQAQEALHRAVQSFRLVQQAEPGGAWVADFSPDGTRLMNMICNDSGCSSTLIRDAVTLKVLRTLEGGTSSDWSASDRVVTANFSPNFSDLSIWDALSGRLVYTVTIPLGDDWLWGWAHVDTNQVAVFTPDGTLKFFDLRTGQLLQTLGEAGQGLGPGVGFRFSADGHYLMTVDAPPKQGALWDLTTGRKLWSVSIQEPSGSLPTFSPDEKQVAVPDGLLVMLIDVASGQKLLTLSQNGFFFAASYTSDGAKLLTTTLDRRAILWNTTTGEKLLEIPNVGFGPSSGDIFSPNGKQFVTFDDPDVLRLWSLEATAGAEIFALSPIDVNEGIAYHPDGVHLAVRRFGQSVEVVDTLTGQTVFTATDTTTDTARLLNREPVFSPDGKLLAVSKAPLLSGETSMIVLDWATGEKLATLIGHTDTIGQIAYTPDGTRLASISYDQTARMWDAITGQELFAVTAFTDSITYFQGIDLAFSPDGARFATAGGFAVKIWDTATSQELLALPKEDLPEIAFAVAFNHNGSQLAVGFRYGAASVWDATTGEKLFDLSGHKGSVTNVTYSPDGTRIATASVDGTVRIWEAATGTLQLTFQPAEAQMLEVAFSANGRHLVVEGGDGVVRIYTLNASELVQIAQSRVTRALTDAECVTYLHVAACPKEP